MFLHSLSLALMAGLMVHTTAVAFDDPAEQSSGQTRAGVHALSSLKRQDTLPETRAGVRSLANYGKEVDQESGTPSDVVRRGRANRTELDRSPRGADGQNRQVDRSRSRRQVDRAAGVYQWGNGFGLPGAYFPFVSGFRTFRASSWRYPYGYGYGGGYPYYYDPYQAGYGYGYGYGFGFGFPPVALGITAQETVRYEDPLRRQWKLVDDGVRKLAEGR